MTSCQDAFISYGRADSKAFAVKLYQNLSNRHLKVWFDFEDIPLGVDFQNQIDDGIEKADNFLFIIAPHSINSPYCGKEIELALKRHKRIIPLLHVEQISRETWQQRNPHGTDADWEAYKAKGLHSSFPNMHPEIGKINWVYFREGIDDFDKSFAGLLQLLERHQEYVHQHTYFLGKALEWERQQKQSRYLLVGEERQQAEDWLKVRFQDEQPPCTPTDLHCEYISESIKNAQNLMTQVFLAYAYEDKAVMEKIRNSLRRSSLTVWTNTTDIPTGEAFEKAIKRGIEQADNIVYLLSPDALNSEYCQQEFNYALSLNKRIIPVQVRETPPEQIPSVLGELQYLDLTDNVNQDDYLLDESQLLKILHEDAAYYNEHKILLTKALKWKRQQENPSILLRGYNLRSAETWLKVALNRTQHPPIPLQEEFISESLRQPPLESLDVFVSYSRTDADFARKLNDSLQIQGKTTWFDQESIASGSDFQQEIYRGIKACDNFLFILSPRSVNSPYCADEVEYAASLNKRFVTVLHREVNPGDLHPELAKVQWIDFNQNQRDFNANFNQLVRTLDTDREHVHSHTKWLQRALEWQQKDRNKDLLLPGSEFAIAQTWLQEAEQKNKRPAATPLQKEFILESGNAIAAQLKKEKRQIIILRSLLSFIFLVAVGAGFSAWQAVQQKHNAEQAQRKAEQSLTSQVDALSRYSKTLTDSNQEFDALIEGIRAGKSLLEQNKDAGQSGYQVEEALQKAIDGVQELNRIEGQTEVRVSPDNQTIATITEGGKVRLWDFQGKERKILSHDGEKITEIYFSEDGKKIATISEAGDKRTIKLWNGQGQLIQSFDPIERFDSMSFSPNGKLIITDSWKEGNSTYKIWKIDGKQLKTLLPNEKFNHVEFSNDGNKIATVSGEGNKRIIKLWNSQWQLIQSFDPIEKFDSMSFSANGKLIITYSWEGDNSTHKIWKIDGKQLKSLLPNEKFNDFYFNKDVNQIATISNNIVKLWTQDGEELQTMHPGIGVESVYFSSKDKTIATVSSDKTVKFWNIDSSDRQVLTGFHTVIFSPENENLIVTYSGEKEKQAAKVWRVEDKQLKSLLPNQRFNHVEFSNDGNKIATVSGEGDKLTIKLWNAQGQLIQSFGPIEKFDYMSFSPNGKLIITDSREGNNRTVKLWKIEGKQLQPLLSNGKFNVVSFSDDGNLIATDSKEGENQSVKLWRVEGKQLQPLSFNQKFNDISVSHDGKLIATYSGERENQSVKLWKIEGKQLQPLLSNGKFNQVSLRNDGKLIATFSKGSDNQKGNRGNLNNQEVNRGSSDNPTVKLWTTDGKGLASFPANDKIDYLKFSRDGKLIATLNNSNNTVKFWILAEDKLTPLSEEVRRDPYYDSIRFSPDSKLIATVNNNKVIQLWDRDGKQLASLDLNESIGQMSFSADSKILAISPDNKAPILWYLKRDEWERQSQAKLNELINQACQKVGNYLKNRAEDKHLCNGISASK